MEPEILKKYNIPVPRYTSYPPANFFSEVFTADDYREAVIDSNDRQPSLMSVYIHFPYCHHKCYYCGCNAVQLGDKSMVGRYLDALKKEMRMVFPLLSHDRKIAQIHYGGGTPTLLPVSVLEELNGMIRSEFDCIESPEIAIECHPGFLDEAYWAALPDAGFNRVSIGVQDFNERVLRLANRKAPSMPVEDIVTILSEAGISVNLDFIYGLPAQTPGSFRQTIERAVAIRPDRVVTFSYAHVPWVNPLQKLLERPGLPSAGVKSELFALASQLFAEAGYIPVGLDHFVLPEDELAKALGDKMLHRNFQGYCTRHTTGQVYAFGVTGISQLAGSYSQNIKDIDTYIDRVGQGRLPVLKGYRLNQVEQITREVISTLMCNHIVDWKSIASGFGLPVDAVKRSVGYNEQTLAAFRQDGLITFDNNRLEMLPGAESLVRVVAASFDGLIREGSAGRYSRSF